MKIRTGRSVFFTASNPTSIALSSAILLVAMPIYSDISFSCLPKRSRIPIPDGPGFPEEAPSEKIQISWRPPDASARASFSDFWVLSGFVSSGFMLLLRTQYSCGWSSWYLIKTLPFCSAGSPAASTAAQTLFFLKRIRFHSGLSLSTCVFPGCSVVIKKVSGINPIAAVTFVWLV